MATPQQKKREPAFSTFSSLKRSDLAMDWSYLVAPSTRTAITGCYVDVHFTAIHTEAVVIFIVAWQHSAQCHDKQCHEYMYYTHVRTYTVWRGRGSKGGGGSAGKGQNSRYFRSKSMNNKCLNNILITPEQVLYQQGWRVVIRLDACVH